MTGIKDQITAGIKDQITADLFLKLRTDVLKAIEHFVSMASIADIPPEDAGTAILACLGSLTAKVSIEMRLTQKDLLDATHIAYICEEERRRRKSK